MKLFLFFFFFLFRYILSAKNTTKYNTTGLCSLTGFESKDPYPSLVKCYKYNNQACCMSVHDDYISTQLNNLLTTSCLRKYSELEDLMCLGCHPFEMYYIDKENKVLNMCMSFALRLWNASDESELSLPTTKFDNCGFKAFGQYIENGQKYLIPSQTFASIYDFFDKVKIPFYEDYTIRLEPEKSDYCYNGCCNISLSTLIIVLYIFVFLV